MTKQVRLFIKGDVIGVGFRAWTKIQAKILDLNGWVKNIYDRPEIFGESGGVEALLQADETKLNDAVEKIKQGPPVSRVDDVEVHWEEVKENFNSFEIVK